MFSKLFGDESVLTLDYRFDTCSPVITIAMKLNTAQGNKGKYVKGQKVYDYDNSKLVKLSADECYNLEQALTSFVTKQAVDMSKPIATKEWTADGATITTNLFVTTNKGLPVILISTNNKNINQETKNYYIIRSKGDLFMIINFIKSTFTVLPSMACYHFWSQWNKKDATKRDDKKDGKDENSDAGGGVETEIVKSETIELPETQFEGIETGEISLF